MSMGRAVGALITVIVMDDGVGEDIEEGVGPSAGHGACVR
jgi:hypothetical protein